ncbi:MAG: hypothetical protein KDD82_14540 [Planctomycetes bacterium]|nr:hypothetical protein [Planctomycetota bacterium]
MEPPLPSPSPGETPRQRRRRRWRRGCLLGLVLVLPLGELGLRGCCPQPPRGFSAGLFARGADGLTRLAPGAQGTHYSREFHVEVAADARGYRARVGVAPEARDGAVWCLGDSFLFGWGVSAPEVATARLTADGLPCANLGMPGDGLAAYPLRLREALAQGGAPRAVVFVVYDNDFSEFELAPSPAEPPAPSLRERVLGLHTVRLGGRVLDGLGLSAVAANLGGYRAQRAAILARDLWIHEPARAGELAPALAALRAALAATPPGTPRHVLRVVPRYAAGGEGTQEALALLERDAADFDLTRLSATLAQLCAGEGASYRELRPADPTQEASWYFPFDLHLTPAGQAALAEALRAAVAD